MTADVISIYTKMSLSLPVALSLFFFWAKKKRKKIASFRYFHLLFFPN